MALGFVDIEYLSGFFCQSRIDLHQTFRDIFMYSGFADSKLTGSLSDGRVGFDNIAGYCQGTFFNIFFHTKPLQRTFFTRYYGDRENTLYSV